MVFSILARSGWARWLLTAHAHQSRKSEIDGQRRGMAYLCTFDIRYNRARRSHYHSLTSPARVNFHQINFTFVEHRVQKNSICIRNFYCMYPPCAERRQQSLS